MTKPLPPNIVKCMTDDQRKSLAKEFDTRTPTDAHREWARTEERRMHETFEQWLNLHRAELYWDHSRMDRKTSNRVGHPDFVIQRAGKVVNVEFKAAGAVPTGAQKDVHAWLESTGNPIAVCRSAQEAIEFTRKELGI